MNPIILVMALLVILTYTIGLNLKKEDFLMLIKKPVPVITGLTGQLLILPLIAFLIAKALVGLYENHIILAGIATIGDVVPLFHLNRLLVKECIALLCCYGDSVYDHILCGMFCALCKSSKKSKELLSELEKAELPV